MRKLIKRFFLLLPLTLFGLFAYVALLGLVAQPIMVALGMTDAAASVTAAIVGSVAPVAALGLCSFMAGRG